MGQSHVGHQFSQFWANHVRERKPLIHDQDLHVVVSDDPEELEASAPQADAILFAHNVDGDPLRRVLPLANRVRWIHSLWTGVEGILTSELLAHPAPLTNGRGVFRRPLAD